MLLSCVWVGGGSFCRTAQFCFGLLMRCLFLGFPLRPPRLLTRQLCGSGFVCRPEFSIIRLKNNSIYLKPDESFVYIGGEFRFHDSSRFRKKAGDAKLPFYHSFVPVLMSLAAESCRSRAESVHLLEPHLHWGKSWKSSNFVTPDDSARNRKMRKMMSLNCSICLMPIFGLERYIEFGLAKAVLPSCVESLLLKQNPTLIYLRNVKSFVVFRAGRKVPHC